MSGTLAKLAGNSRRAVADGLYETGSSQKQGMTRFGGALEHAEGAAIISEIKFASPSQGTIRGTEDPAGIAVEMVAGGASAISVLTQPHLFGGSPEYFMKVREAVSVPMLMKDIVVDRRQVDAAVRMGADCILLIQAVFDAGYASDMDGFIERAHRGGVQVLLEVHDRAELDSALATGCDMVGVNNRNLDTLEVSLETTRRVLEGYGDPRPAISESGIRSPADIRYLRECGADAFLVGTGIMERGNVKGGVRALVDSL